MAELYNGLTLAVAAVALGVHRARPLAGALVRGSNRTVDRLAGAARDRIRDGVRDRRAPRGSTSATPVPPIIPIYIGSSVILGILRVAAWAYLLASALRGVAAGEDPRAGWQLAALASGIVLFALVLVNVVSLVPVPEEWVVDLYQWTVVHRVRPRSPVPAGGLHVGLPSLDPDDDDTYIGYDEDNDEGFEDEEAGYEGGPVYDDEFPEEGIRQARSVGSAETRLRRKFSPSSTDSIGA